MVPPRKRRLHQWKHPFHAHPFEALLFGSWTAAELIKIESGTLTLHFVDNNHQLKDPLSDIIRIRSRKATLSDCSSFLRPGVDICVLSAFQCSDNLDQFSTNPVWLDAKISSIQRKPHKSQCSCQYYVNFYVTQGSLGTEIRTLSKEVKAVGIDQICILQRIARNSCEDQPHRWASSEDCSTVSETKLLLGKFLSDISWLIATSVVKKVSFCSRSLQNKIVYQVLGSESDNSDSHVINVVNFKVKDGTLVPIVSQLNVSSHENRTIGHDASHDNSQLLEDEVSPMSYEVEGLRRSKRRNIQPQRYLGYDVKTLDVGRLRTWPYKMSKEKHEEKSLLEEDSSEEEDAKRVQKADNNKVNSCKEIIVYRRRNKTNQNHDLVATGKVHDETGEGSSSKYQDLINTLIPKKENGVEMLKLEPSNDPAMSSDDAEKVNDFSFSSSRSRGRPKHKRKDSFGLDDDMGLETRWKGMDFFNGGDQVQQKRNHSTTSLRNRSSNIDEEERDHKGRTLNADACKEMIDSYLKSFNSMPTEEKWPSIADQWMETSNMGQKKEEEMSQRGEEEGEEEEVSELDRLWQEMDSALASSYLHDETEASTVAETEKESKKTCQHDYRLDEQIGIYCIRCGFVKTEIRDISAPFVQQRPSRHQEEKQTSGEAKSEPPKAHKDDHFHDLFPTHASRDEPISKENDNVWALVPELREKMHDHQKKAFQFLWQNIAGSMEQAQMGSESKRRSGGCVISHAPGAGKTFLIISFLVSYLKLFPGNKPLVLAPKTTLYTWYKEFIKWNISVPVYLIHGRRTQRDFKPKSKILHGVPRPTSDVKYVFDCLDKIQKWHAHPSVLVMGYTSFLALMREDSKFEHRRYMAKALRESPGILILDEGHNPRSTKSRLRKGLMKVKTEVRVLLSGTLFQNNFCEYFNTLCLARPKFVHEVLKELDPKYLRKKKMAEKARHLLESRARKFFLDKIAKKIDSDDGEERMQGLNVLRKITSGFIDVYDSGNSDNLLPGLQIYTLLMNSTDVQQEILQTLHMKKAECSGYPLEVELLVTLGSIHPWLVKTVSCAAKFFTEEQLKKLDRYRIDLKIGSKVRFVLSLVFRVVSKKEKVLIFCHNLAPVRLLVELFEKFFQWQKGREILLLNGELELFERGKVIEKFEERGGVSKVLLASITACAEGISLTSASRVVFLDSEWNPSKTKQAIARAFRPGQQKMVYVYQLLATGSLEEDKYRRTTWKEWVSSLIFSEAFVEDPSKWQAEKIEDDILREMVEEDKSKAIHMIMKNEKASTN